MVDFNGKCREIYHTLDAMGMSQVVSLSRCVRHMQGRPEAQMDGGSLQFICCPKQVVIGSLIPR